MPKLDETHDPARRCWVPSAESHPDFPIQNLPHGVFVPADGRARGGMAIGEYILDLRAALEAGLLTGLAAEAAEAAAQPQLNDFLGLGAAARRALRRAAADLLDARGTDHAEIAGMARKLLHRMDDCQLLLPARIGDYTDFYAGLQHATNTGAMLRPDSPLTPNYRHVPLAYHGRSSSIHPSGSRFLRPQGQRKPARETHPSFGPSRNLDYELELGIWIGRGNEGGTPIPIEQAAGAIAGYCLLNDWSARDIQGWEAQPLGPFLGKSFWTTVSPWIVTPEALAPFRAPLPPQDPVPLAYLRDEADLAEGALDIQLEVLITTALMREHGQPPHRLSRVSSLRLYWTPAQMVAHHASGGCNLRPGDLFGSGTISGDTPDSFGSLLELTRGGRQPITLESGETRRFLEDGDEVTLTARAAGHNAATIGFGACSGRVAG
jgi:fumarylacetoacetase